VNKTDILIIGGGPAGVVSAVTAKKNYPEKNVTLVRDKNRVVVPCGIPYVFNRLDSVEKNIMPDKSLEKNNVNLIIDKATSLDTENKTASFEKGDEINYEKLIIATGSTPILPPIEGANIKGVWQIKKDFEYLANLREAVIKSKSVVIVGGGFIGVELAEELSRIEGIKITIVEKLKHCLATTFDEGFTVAAEEMLKNKGVEIKTGCMVEKIIGKDKVEQVILTGGEELPADLVILSIGAKPNVALIEDTQIKTGKYGGIWVDEYMRTSEQDVFAIGDCSETRDFFTGQHVPVMLASTASMEARVAGSNLYQLKFLKQNKGSLNTFSTYIDGLVLGVVGLTEEKANSDGFEIVTGEAQCTNHHPGTLPGTKPVVVKLVFSKSSGTLLGAQIMGPENMSEFINIVSLAIQEKTTAYDLEFLQVSTHPLLTPAPTVSPIINASRSAIEKIEKK